MMKSKPDSGFDYADYIEENNARLQQGSYAMVNVPEFISLNERLNVKGKLGEIDVVQHAYYFFKIYKGIIVDLVIGKTEWKESNQYFKMRSSEDALRVISVELNFFYQVLYTKVVVVRSKMGYIFRFVSFSAVVAAFFVFYSLEKRGLNNVDIKITYTLLFSAVALEVIAFFMLVFSDWTVAALVVEGQTLASKATSWKAIIQKIRAGVTIILGKCLKLRRPNWSTKDSSNVLDKARRVVFRRWSESVSCYNLIDYCLKESPRVKHNNIVLDYSRFFYIKILDVLGLKEFRDKIKYISSEPLSKELWDIIFQEQIKSTLFDEETTETEDWKNVGKDILSTYVDGVDFDQRLLILHIATEICYNVEDKDYIVNINDVHRREYSKILSDYMLYLLIMQPTMMTSISGLAQARFRDTCAEAKKLFSQSKLGPGVEKKLACRRILEMNVELDPVYLKEDNDKSVLFCASILAKELDNKLKEKKWRLMSQVWVDMLSFGACNCELTSHAQLLSSGGEFITFVWLLMVHLAKAGHLQTSRGGRFAPH